MSTIIATVNCDPAGRAKELLWYYFSKIAESRGFILVDENREEVESIIDLIVAAAVAEVKKVPS